MQVFNSLGSNYTLKMALACLFATPSKVKNKRLEKLIKARYGGDKVILTYKGRHAISLALGAINEPKCHVAINGYTCLAVYKPIKEAGLKIKYLDIDRSSLNFSPSTLKKALDDDPQIKVVIIQNTLGCACAIESIAAICKERHVVLIEDLAHSVEMSYDSDRQAGSYGDFAILSFGQDKVVDGVAGGALIIHNSIYKNSPYKLRKVPLCRQIKNRWYPIITYIIRHTYSIKIGKFIHFATRQLGILPRPVRDDLNDPLAGLPAKLPSWISGLILRQYDQYEKTAAHRREIASIYDKVLSSNLLLGNFGHYTNSSTNVRYGILVKDRQKLIDHLATKGIYVSDIWYDAPIAPKKYSHLIDYDGVCPVADKISDEMLNLPTHVNISKENANLIAQTVNKWLESHDR